MQIISARLPDSHEIVKFSDLHAGSVLFHEAAFQEAISYVKKKRNTFCTLDGDLIEAIIVDDKRFQSDVQAPGITTPVQQCDYIIELLRPIKDKILAIGAGNHEFALLKYGDLVRDIICKALDVHYGTYSYKLVIKTRQNATQYKMFSTHGNKTIRSTAGDPVRKDANERLQVKDALRELAGDCHVMTMGHSHRLLVVPPISKLYISDDGEKIRQNYTHYEGTHYVPEDLRWYVNTGSFMKLYRLGVSGYAERRGLRPAEIGFPKIVVNDRAIHTIDRVII